MSEWLPIEAQDVMRGDTIRLPGMPATEDEVVVIYLGHMREGAGGHWDDAPWEHIEIKLSKRMHLKALQFEPAQEFEVLADEAFTQRRLGVLVDHFHAITPVLTIVRKS